MLKPRGLYYIAHINNLESILKRGILCHRKIEEEKIEFTPIYDADIVSSRSEKKVTEKSNLWDFVSLYFQPRNAMLYRVIFYSGVNVEDLLIIGLKSDLLYKNDIFITTGKYDIHRYMNLFEKLGIKHSVLFDGDTNNDKHKKINEFIEKKKNSFTLNLHKFVEGELEDFLEIEKVDDRYKKPLNVMWHYKNGEIKQEKIDALIKIIEKLVSQKEE